MPRHIPGLPDPDPDQGWDWRDDALCPQVDPEIFFPVVGSDGRDAKAVCAGCRVRAECLEYALDHDERWGIWGGLSENQRRALAANRPTAKAREMQDRAQLTADEIALFQARWRPTTDGRWQWTGQVDRGIGIFSFTRGSQRVRVPVDLLAHLAPGGEPAA